jgi:hypothetical protein
MEHGFAHFLLPAPLDRLPFLLANLKLPVEAFNGHEGILHWGPHGNPELGLLLAKFGGNFIQYLWEFLQDLQRNVPIGS